MLQNINNSFNMMLLVVLRRQQLTEIEIPQSLQSSLFLNHFI